MLVSYRWLQEHFTEPLPPVEELVDLLTLNAYEIEEYTAVGDDIVIDVDVLPNRSHDSLCHRGVAKEIAVLLERAYKEFDIEKAPQSKKNSGGLSVSVEDTDYCTRYIGKKIENITVTETPKWMREYLEVLGQRSINVIVDITNFVMLETGQPMHAFDADKLSGSQIVVRRAKSQEAFTTLDGTDVTLTDETLVIADEQDALAIAGVKGGKKAEVDENTTNIVLESANFNSTAIRKATRRVGIQTDSSKRYENGISPESAGRALDMAVSLIAEYAGGKADFYASIDVYPKRPGLYKIGITTEEVNRLLGTYLSDSDIEQVLERLRFDYQKVLPSKAVLEAARSVVGSAYKRPSEMQYDAPDAFSCSSLISFAYVQAGVYMPSLIPDKFVYGAAVSKKDLRPGDVIFVNTGEGTGDKAPVIHFETVEWMPGTKIDVGVDHAGIYMGDGKVLHTTWKTGKAVIEDLEEAGQFEHIVGYRRFFAEDSERYVVTVPKERLDLRILADLVEEIGRIYGYDSVTPQVFKSTEAKVNPGFYYENLIRNTLIEAGYSEVLTYAFTKKGDIAVANPIASDKGYMRKSIFKGFEQSLDTNFKNADLLGLDMIRIFEIGTVFTKKGEKRVLGLGVRVTRSYMGSDRKAFRADPKKMLTAATDALKEVLGARVDGEARILSSADGVILEIDLGSLLDKLSMPKDYGQTLQGDMQTGTYSSLSPYPFMTRDVAVFVPVGTKQDTIERILIEKSGALLAREPKLFDVFTKTFDDKSQKTSYAYRLVFQSLEKTLTDEEVNIIMDDVYQALSAQKGWDIR